MMEYLIIVVYLCVYMIPSIIAWNKKDFLLVLLVNVFLGWTGIGWIGALILALRSPDDNFIIPM